MEHRLTGYAEMAIVSWSIDYVVHAPVMRKTPSMVGFDCREPRDRKMLYHLARFVVLRYSVHHD